MFDRWREQRRNFKEFRRTGYFDVRRASDASNYADPKLGDARLWLYRENHSYERKGFIISILALVVALLAVFSKYACR